MTPEEIAALVKTTVEAALQDADTFKPLGDSLTQSVQAYLTQVLEPLETRLDGLENVVTAPKAPGAPEEPEAGKDADSPLAQRLSLLETQLAEANQAREQERAEREALELENHLSGVVGKFNPKFSAEVKQLLRGQLGELKREGETYLTPDGQTIDEATKAFFDTEVGKHFLPPVSQDGLGTAKPGAVTAPASVDLSSMLFQAFS
jgi:hypothetical protein